MGARFVLVALAVQLTLSLPYFDGTAQAAPSTRLSARPSTATPAGKDCTICAVMTLADKVFFAAPPLLMLPEAVELLYRTTDAEFVHLRSAGAASDGVTVLPRTHHAS
jgi:hypothetical protein